MKKDAKKWITKKQATEREKLWKWFQELINKHKSQTKQLKLWEDL